MTTDDGGGSSGSGAEEPDGLPSTRPTIFLNSVYIILLS